MASTLFSGFYWGAAYLAIAAGLTLTYKVQRFGNFAQAEIMLFGAYVGFTMMWSPYFYTLVNDRKVLNIDVSKDEVLTWDLLFWACVTGFVLTGLLGVLIDRLIYSRFRKNHAIPQTMMIASLGVAMILRGILYLRYGASQYLFVPDIDWRLSTSRHEFPGDKWWWPSSLSQTARFRFGERTVEKSHDDMDKTACIEEGKPDNFSSSWDVESEICNVTEYLPFYEIQESTYYLQYTKAALIIGVFASVVLLLIVLNMTRLGRQMRAVADNPDLAASSGINVERVHMTCAFLAAGISGFGGVLFGMYVRVNPEVGLSILLPAFSVIVLGTLGSVRGVLIAAIIVGLVRSISEPILIGTGSVLDRPSYAAFGEAMPYMFLIAVLMIMPKGLGDALENWQIERARNRQGSIFSLRNVSLFLLLIICIWKSTLVFGLILWGILNFWFYLLSHIKVGSSNTLPSLPELPYVGDQLRRFSSSQKLSIFVAALFQITVVSILDGLTSGIGIVYLLVDYVFFLLSIVGIITLYSSTVSLIPELNKIIAPARALSLEEKEGKYRQRMQLLVSGFLVTFVSYGADYLVAGSGTIYYLIDVIFLLLQIFGLVLVVITLFLSRSKLMSLFNDLGTKLKALPEIQKWGTLYGCILLTYFVYYLDAVTSGSGVIYYIIDLVYLAFLLLGVAATLFTVIKLKAEIDHRLNLVFVLIGGLLLYFEDMIEPSLVRDTESKMYVKEIAYLFLILSFNDVRLFIFSIPSRVLDEIDQNESFSNLKEGVLTNVNPYVFLFGIILFLYVPFGQIKMLGFFFIFYSINPFTDFVSEKAGRLQSVLWNAIMPPSKAQYGRSSERGSWVTFAFFLVLLIYVAWWLPSVTNFTKSMQISRIIVLVCAFSILAFSLNLHTGITGMTNFGVIFFAGIGAITMGILTVPEDRPGGQGWSPIFGIFNGDFTSGILVAVIVSGIAGWLLAYPTARLRMDYFAIVTISLGEIVRISMRAEPLLRAGTGTTAIGIQLYDLPLEHWWVSTMDDSVGEWLNLVHLDPHQTEAAPYTVLLAAIALLSFFLVWTLAERMLNSPWGRILRAIREDEDVTMHHGHNVFQHKAMSLAVGGAIAGFGGGLWAWLNMSVLDDFISPVKSTFLIWAAFIVGGRANNRGMVIGAFIIVLTEFLFNLLPLARGDIDNQFHDSVAGIDEFFAWLILDVIGSVTSDLSITETLGNPDDLRMNLVYLKLVMIGLVILVSLMLSEKGLLPEVPKRPENPSSHSSSQDNAEKVDFKGRRK
uniref:High-affinity branched-chain amino acid transport system permease protein BraE (LivM) n=1 Tax=uncultured marine group II/III euryarchaeote AD1000_28_C09 TaxID=1457746 RepID=A0A075FML2_9EURY|nr:high-affinity branched-chain amino acid transport system permease protein BraE (livM) [uncultured marine group II/III euryarchaeote AD1000_28_C09]